MPKIVLSMDGLVLKEIALDKSRISVGRKPHNDIQIDNLAISGEHAAITTILNDAFLEDLNSTNGTYVNGQSVKKCALKDGDIIELGKYRIKFIKDAVQPDATSTFDKPFSVPPEFAATQTATLRSASDTVVVGGFAESPTATHGAASNGVLSASASLNSSWAQPEPVPPVATGVVQILSGRNAGRELELSKSLTTLGKPGVQVAVIARRPNGYSINHVEGAQVPLLNGRPISGQVQALADNDVIEIAGVAMRFTLDA